MTVVLRPTRAYEQRDQLVTLQWSGLCEVYFANMGSNTENIQYQ